MLLVPANGAFPILFPACLWDSVKQLLTWPSFASWSALNRLAVLHGQECRKIKKSWVKINFIDILENRVLLNEWLAKGTPALFGLQHRWGLQSPRAQGCGLRQPGRVPRQSHAALESCQSEAMPRAQGWYRSYFHTQKAGETTRHGVSSFPLGKMWCVLLGLTQPHPQFKVQPPACSRLCSKQRDHGSTAKSFYLRIILEIFLFSPLFACTLALDWKEPSCALKGGENCDTRDGHRHQQRNSCVERGGGKLFSSGLVGLGVGVF